MLGTAALSVLLFAMVCLAAGCGPSPDTGEDAEVTTRGSAEVTARLAEIPGEFVNRKDYDYAFVMQYDVLTVHRGEAPGKTVYIGHYNPLKPRDTVADERVEEVGGNLKRFRVGDVHRMALEQPIDDHFMGGIINRYFGEDTGPIWWAVWTNRVVE